MTHFSGESGGSLIEWKWAEILQTPHLFCTQWSSQYTAWGVLSPLLFVKKLEFNINKDFWILDSLIPIQDSWSRKSGDAQGAGELSAGSRWDRKSLRLLPTATWLASVTPDPVTLQLRRAPLMKGGGCKKTETPLTLYQEVAPGSSCHCGNR